MRYIEADIDYLISSMSLYNNKGTTLKELNVKTELFFCPDCGAERPVGESIVGPGQDAQYAEGN